VGVVSPVLRTLTTRVADALPNIDDLSDENIAAIMLTYGTIVGENFIPWLSSTWTRCRSSVAREACRTNLRDEIIEDHPQMLRTFLSPVEIYRERPYVVSAVNKAVQDARREPGGVIAQIRRFTESADGVSGVWVLGALETTSCAFISWMDAAANRLSLADRVYLEKHGEADIMHADQFAAAVEAEASERHVLLTSDDPSDYPPLAAVHRLLDLIFHAA